MASVEFEWGPRLLRLFGGVGLAALVAAPASAMSYRLLDVELPNCRGSCPKVIVASGTIQQNEHLLFSEFFDSVKDSEKLSNMVLINSPGGFNGGAVSLGMLLRKAKLTVWVGRPSGGPVTRTTGLTSGTCASACVLVLAGGTSRYFVSGSRVGVHRAHMGPEVRDPTTRAVVSGQVQHDAVRHTYLWYFKQMGISQTLMGVIEKTPSETIYWLNPAELGKYGLARDASKQR